MRYQVIIPTYSGHLSQVELGLSSFEKFLTDKEHVDIHLIVSRPEVQAFTELANQHTSLTVTVISLHDIIQKEEGVETDEKQLLEQVGKFNFQSLKKIYGVKHFGMTTSLVLDSEALMIRETSLAKIFEAYERDKFIISASPVAEQIKVDVAHTSFEILGKPVQDIWFFEYYYWFFEKKYVDEMFAYIFQTTGKSLLENLLYRKPLFEYNLYALYLFLFHADVYRFIDAQTLLSTYLNETELSIYRKAVGNTTASFEYLCWGLTPKNSASFSKLFSDMRMAFFRYDDRHGDREAQIAFVQNNTNIRLLTSRMVTKDFSVNEYTVPMNYDNTHNHPILSGGNSLLTKIIKRGAIFARKVRIRLDDIISGVWYSLVLKIRLDKNGMLLRYHFKNSELKLDTNLAFDVGAYTGTSLKRLRTLGYKNVICFEPSARSFMRLYKKHHGDLNVSFINRAVSDASGHMITLYENPDTPTLNTATEEWFSIPRHKGLVHSFTKRNIETLTLDDSIKLIGAIPGYIKIDVEGHELSVLRGLSHKPTMISFEWISERKARNIEVLQRVRDIGFTTFYLTREEALPDYTPETALSFDDVVAQWSSMMAVGIDSPWGNLWCR